MTKRLKILIGILVLVLGVAGFQIMNQGGGVVGGTKVQVENVNRDHLRISALYPINYTLKSVGKNPFDNPLTKEKKPEPAPTVVQPPPAPVETQTIPVTPPVMQRPETTQTEKKADQVQRAMKLKAIAKSGDRRVAVVESNGKTTSSFVGGAVGSYIITNIGEREVTLQDFSGNTVTLELSR